MEGQKMTIDQAIEKICKVVCDGKESLTEQDLIQILNLKEEDLNDQLNSGIWNELNRANISFWIAKKKLVKNKISIETLKRILTKGVKNSSDADGNIKLGDLIDFINL